VNKEKKSWGSQRAGCYLGLCRIEIGHPSADSQPDPQGAQSINQDKTPCRENFKLQRMTLGAT
jgi:hypothetical protein